MKTPRITAPRQERATAYTLTFAVLLHGIFIGVAALWPTSPRAPEAPVRITEPFEPGEPVPESSQPPAPEPESAPTSDVAPPPDELMPTLEQPDAVDPEPPKPAIRHGASIRVPNRPTAVNAVRGNRIPNGMVSGGGGTGNPSGVPGASHAARWSVAAIPPYPAALRQAHVQGNGSVRVTTDAAGRVTSAMMVRSTGNAALDDNTCRHARTAWSGPANASIVVPVTYRMP